VELVADPTAAQVRHPIPEYKLGCKAKSQSRARSRPPTPYAAERRRAPFIPHACALSFPLPIYLSCPTPPSPRRRPHTHVPPRANTQTPRPFSPTPMSSP
jgi:hypothetical protein